MRARLGAVGVLATLTLLGAACGRSGDHNETSAAPPTEAVADTSFDASGAGDPGTEGITVHGHWQIDVHNEDGSLDRTVEFENALDQGDTALTQLLSRQATPGEWQIYIDSEFGTPKPCVDTVDTPVECTIRQIGGETSSHFPNLTVDASAGTSLTLSGHVTVGTATDIVIVGTTLITCASTLSPDDCLLAISDNVYPFTFKGALDSTTDEFEPVPVTAGQLVQVSVTLSFS